MTPPPKCCNPFNVKGHNCYREKLTLITEKCDEKLSVFYNLHMCAKCKTKVYKKKSEIQFQEQNISIKKHKMNEQLNIAPDKESVKKVEREDNDEDYICVSVDNNIKKMKLVETVQEMILSPTKSSKNLSGTDKIMLLKPLKEIISNIGESSSSTLENNHWIEDFKTALNKATTKTEKTFLLTTLPVTWSIRKTAKEFGVSRRMVSSALKLRKNEGFATVPNLKSVRPISDDLKNKIIQFYLSDDVCRVLPGAKDFKSIVINGKRQHESKRLLLGNLSEIHANFLAKHPDVTVSLSVFSILRPQQCILGGPKGTHNVCVCKIHENMRLKFVGLKHELALKKIDLKLEYRDYFDKITCEEPDSSCFLRKCSECSKDLDAFNELKSTILGAGVETITYNQWLTNDRCQLMTVSESVESFIKNISNELSDVFKHDFLAKSQAAYLENLKNSLEEDEFIITMDFSENYSFDIQNAIQSQYWSKGQATLHVYVVYYKETGQIKHKSFVVLSECLNHDATAVHLYSK